MSPPEFDEKLLSLAPRCAMMMRCTRGGRENGVRREFQWVSRSAEICVRWDLRLLGWSLVRDQGNAEGTTLWDGRAATRAGDWRNLATPATVAAVGVECAGERAAMLAGGLGDALSAQVAVGELAIRLARLGDRAGALPRLRHLGPVVLDLLHRDARSGDRWLALHPREFALLWRLADAAGGRVTREALLADVWRLGHVPQTNSLEVHVSRLRSKLALARAAWLVETDPRGGYRLARDLFAVRWTAPAPLRRVAAT